jgi:ABC-2 type transport system permease protein
MRLLWEIAARSFRQQFVYRTAAAAGLATNLFFGLLRVAVMAALYGSRSEAAGLSLQDAITFTGLTQGIIAVLSLFGWYELMHSIDSGQVGSDLLRPVGVYRLWLARDLGRMVSQLFLRGLTVMLVYALLFNITIPNTAGWWAAFALTFILAWWVSFSWRFLVNLAAFWSPNAIGIGRLAFTLAWFLSGFLMPLRFFPDWFVRLCYLTPFPHAINTVVEVYLGLLTGPELAAALLMQIAWAGGLTLLGALVLRAGFRKLVIQGG